MLKAFRRLTRLKPARIIFYRSVFVSFGHVSDFVLLFPHWPINHCKMTEMESAKDNSIRFYWKKWMQSARYTILSVVLYQGVVLSVFPFCRMVFLLSSIFICLDVKIRPIWQMTIWSLKFILYINWCTDNGIHIWDGMDYITSPNLVFVTSLMELSLGMHCSGRWLFATSYLCGSAEATSYTYIPCHSF